MTALALAHTDMMAEEAVVSALLLDDRLIDQVARTVVSADFEDLELRIVFAALLDLRDAGTVVTPITLAHHLEAPGRLGARARELVGYLLDCIPSTTGIDDHAAMVAARGRRRRGAAALARLRVTMDAAFSDGQNLDEILAIGRQVFADIEGNAARPRYSLIDDEAILGLPPLEWLVGDLIPERAAVMMSGPPGVGKSFLALDIALSVAAGLPVFGRPTRRAQVVYVAAEGSAGIPRRVAAWKDAHGLSGYLGVRFLTEPLPLMDSSAIAAFCREVRAGGEPLGLVVLDTLSRCAAGSDENLQKDASMHVDAMNRIQREAGGSVLLLHHPSKFTDDPRGSTVYAGAMDTIISVKGDEGKILVSCAKQKDAIPFPGFALHLLQRETELGGSCTLITATDGLAVVDGSLLEKQATTAKLLSTDFLEDGATTASWLAASLMPERSFYRVVKDLTAMGWVVGRRAGRTMRYTLTDAGKKATTDNCQTTANDCQDTQGELMSATGGPYKGPPHGSNPLAVVEGEE